MLDCLLVWSVLSILIQQKTGGNEHPGLEGMPKVHGPSSSLGRLNAEKGTCKCGALHGPEDPHRISQVLLHCQSAFPSLLPT